MDSFSEIWSAACDYMKEALNVSDVAFNLWISPLVPESFDGQTAKFTCPTSYKIQIITTRYDGVIKEALTAVMGFDDIEVIYLFKPQKTDDEKEQSEEKNHLSSRDSTSTFENFIVGSTNKFAYATALNAAEHPGEEYNPLFIYGKSGLGKTHLLKAIKNRMLEKNPSANVLYTTSENFTNDLIYYLGKKNMGEFHDKYRNVDALLIDDIQFIANKKSTEEEFFHTFNNLYENHHQIVLTADRPPNEMLRLEDRLKTRFEWGLMVDVAPPDFETRFAIVQNKAAMLGVKLPNEVTDYIAENITSNVRQIEGTLNKILAYRDLLDDQVNEETVSRAIRDMLKKSNDFAPTPSIIVGYICSYFHVDEETLRGQSRSRDVVAARQIAMYLIRRMTSMSLNDIGKEFGDRDHSTILHSLDKVESTMRSDPAFAEKVKEITTNINSKK